MAHQCKLETSPREKGDDFHFHIPYLLYNLKDKGHKTEEWDSNYPWHQKILILVSLKIKIISPKTCMKTHGKEDASFFLKFWSGGRAFEPGDSNRPTPKASGLSFESMPLRRKRRRMDCHTIWDRNSPNDSIKLGDVFELDCDHLPLIE